MLGFFIKNKNKKFIFNKKMIKNNGKYFSASCDTEDEIFNIEIKSWVKAISSDFLNEKQGISGLIKNQIYEFLSSFNISLYIIDLNLRESIIREESPTFMKINIMFNPQAVFSLNAIEILYEKLSDFFSSYNTISFSSERKN